MSQSQTTDEETSIETDVKCDQDILICHSLHNITECLKYYQTLDLYKNANDLSLYFDKYKELVNDYHHILSHHLNQDQQTQQQNDGSFQSIYHFIINHVKCENIHKCCIYIRTNRDRSKNIQQITNDESLLFYIDFVDSIHCHFLHSYDCGYRQKQKHQTPSNNNAMDISTLLIDTEMIQLKERIKNSRYYIQKLRGDVRFYNNKFVTNALTFNTDTNVNKEDKEDTEEEKYDDSLDAQYFFSSRYSFDEMTDEDTESESFQDGSIPKQRERDDDYSTFGQRYYYWKYYKHNWYNTEYGKWSINRKYNNLKDEMINNKLYTLDLETYKYTYYKACKLLKESNEIKCIKSDYTEIKLHYEVPDEIPLKVSNVMSIIFYTDYDLLSYNLSKTFRKLTFYEENDDEMKARNSEYWHWSKILRETVECYGLMMGDNDKIDKYYHGINKMVFRSFLVRFCGPTSTSIRLEVMASFVYENGMILELSPYDTASSLRVFNCSFISCFVLEEEQMFFGGEHTLKYISIRMVKTNENYRYFILSVQLLDNIINAETFDIDKKSAIEYNKAHRFAKRLITNNDINNEYIQSVFNEYCASKRYIEIDLTLFKSDHNHKRFKDIFVDKRTNNLILIDCICCMFKNCEKIVIENNKRHLSSRYLSRLLLMMSRINKDKDIKLMSIKVENVQFEQETVDRISNEFMKNNWKLKVKESVTVQFGEWINIANLTLFKLYQNDKYNMNSKGMVIQSMTEQVIENEIIL